MPGQLALQALPLPALAQFGGPPAAQQHNVLDCGVCLGLKAGVGSVIRGVVLAEIVAGLTWPLAGWRSGASLLTIVP